MRHDPIRDQLDPIIREIGIREVGRRAGVSGSGVQRWLAGEMDLRLQTLYAVLDACEFEIRAAKRKKAKA